MTLTGTARQQLRAPRSRGHPRESVSAGENNAPGAESVRHDRRWFQNNIRAHTRQTPHDCSIVRRPPSAIVDDVEFQSRYERLAHVAGAALVLAVALPCGSAVRAQGPDPGALSFDVALARLVQRSDALAGADASIRSKQELSHATRRLRWPEVSVETRHAFVRKTLELDTALLAPLAESFGLPAVFRVVDRQWRLRPMLTAVAPIYTGGQIPAAQEAAAAAVRQAEAERDVRAQSLVVQLVQAYFGQQLADRAAAVRADVRDGLQQHLDHTEALEQQGFATRAQRLQVLVARDHAERELQGAIHDADTARAHLASLLHSDVPIVPATGLFVIASPLGSVQEFQRDVSARHPQLTRLGAIRDQSREAVNMQRSAFKPTAYVVGQYDLYRTDASLTDPDWAFGAGVTFVLFSGSGRRHRVNAARERQAQVEAEIRDVARQLEVGVISAYNDLETARRQFLLLDSTMAHAEENVRLQELSFREGLATSLDVIDARLGLGRAQIERAQTAFQFTLALARLLDATGQAERFTDHISRADTVLEP